MKSSLPGYLEYGKSYDKQPGTEPSGPQQTARRVPVRLSKARAQLLIVTLVLLAELSFIVFQLMRAYPVISPYVKSIIHQEADITFAQYSTRLTAMVDYYSTSVTRIAEDPETAKLFTAGDEAALRAREAVLRRYFPKALNVQLLPPGLVSVNMESSPPLSYAALNQMRMAEDGSQIPPMEVLLFGTLQQHINIVRRVTGPASSGVAGHIMLSLPDNFLQDILDELQQVHGYIELQQTVPKGDHIVVAVQGNIDNNEGDAALVVPIAGSRWQIAYWPPASSLVYLFSINVPLLSAVLLILTGVLLLIISLFRRLIDDSLISS